MCSMCSKKILMACANYWTSPFQVGSHHLARGFLQAGHKVAFLSDPVSPLHRFAGGNEALNERFDIYRRKGIIENSGQLWSYVPFAWLTPHNKPLLRSHYVSRHWIRHTNPNLLDMLSEHDFDSVDLLYIDSPVYAGILDVVKSRRSVFRIADNCLGFGKFTDAIRQNEREIASRVDVTLYTAKNLLPIVQELKTHKTLFFPNGVNFRHFHEGERTCPREFYDLNGPIAIYVGAMDSWFDFNLVNHLSDAMEDITFVLIGPTDFAADKLAKRKNLRLLGQRPFSQLPQFLHNADVGIIPFDVQNHPLLVNSINPLKLYEYMACGLPVVATRWPELEALNSGAYLANNLSDFVKGIRHSLSMKESSAERVSWASNFDWGNRVKELLMI